MVSSTTATRRLVLAKMTTIFVSQNMISTYIGAEGRNRTSVRREIMLITKLLRATIFIEMNNGSILTDKIILVTIRVKHRQYKNGTNQYDCYDYFDQYPLFLSLVLLLLLFAEISQGAPYKIKLLLGGLECSHILTANCAPAKTVLEKSSQNWALAWSVLTFWSTACPRPRNIL